MTLPIFGSIVTFVIKIPWYVWLIILFVIAGIIVYNHDSDASKDALSELSQIEMGIVFIPPQSNSHTGKVSLEFSGPDLSDLTIDADLGGFVAGATISNDPENMKNQYIDKISDGNLHISKTFKKVHFPDEQDILQFDIDTLYFYQELKQNAQLCVVSEVNYNGDIWIFKNLSPHQFFGKCTIMNMSLQPS